MVHQQRAIRTHGQCRAQLVLHIGRPDGDHHHLFGQALLLQPQGFFQRDFVEGVDALFDAIGNDAAVISFYTDSNVEIDDALDADKDAFHRQNGCQYGFSLGRCGRARRLDSSPMNRDSSFQPSEGLKNVRYEIRGALARRSMELERQGYEIISLNIGNPGAYGFRTPEILRLALVQNLPQAEGYSYQKGIYPAREAILLQQQNRGIRGGTTETMFIGNGTSELIDMTLRALLSDGDEVLVPAPDYPLWTAAVTLNGGRAVHYGCRPENSFYPDPDEIEALITPRTRALVVINPNNPTGAVYPREVLERMARVAEKHQLVILSDEIYDGITYDGVPFVPIASLVNDTLCATLSGLSKVYRAAGYRVGWVSFSGAVQRAGEYLAAMELLSSMRMCSNVPAQYAVHAALGGYQSIVDLHVARWPPL